MPFAKPRRRRGRSYEPGLASSATKRLRSGILALLVVLVIGTLGYVAFGYSVLDACFQTVITVTTVGFGEVHRFGSGEKIFTIVIIFAGVGT
ncbi:MAG: potassium channel family protein, partial [Actinomycetota bacterium]|nr:potassium channel family protein [Actinomycetota bacterium]